MKHQLIKNPFDMGYEEEEILRVSQLFIEYCMTLKKLSMTPGSNTSDRYDPNYPNWEENVDQERLLKLQSKELPLDTSNANNLYHGRDELLDVYATQIAEILGKDYEKCRESGMLYYPPKGFMGWHTNASSACDRIYIVYSSTGDSFFRYYNEETKEIVTDYDSPGLSWRKFTITNEPPHFWHCVGSNCDRISLGFRLDQREVNWK